MNTQLQKNIGDYIAEINACSNMHELSAIKQRHIEENRDLFNQVEWYNALFTKTEKLLNPSPVVPKKRNIFKTVEERLKERQFYVGPNYKRVETDSDIEIEVYTAENDGYYLLLAFSGTRGKPDIQCAYQSNEDRARRIKSYTNQHSIPSSKRKKIVHYQPDFAKSLKEYMLTLVDINQRLKHIEDKLDEKPVAQSAA